MLHFVTIIVLMKITNMDVAKINVHVSIVLLEYELNDNEKAEYHYRQALSIDRNRALRNYNFASFLKNKHFKYSESLIYCDKAYKLLN